MLLWLGFEKIFFLPGFATVIDKVHIWVNKRVIQLKVSLGAVNFCPFFYIYTRVTNNLYSDGSEGRASDFLKRFSFADIRNFLRHSFSVNQYISVKIH